MTNPIERGEIYYADLSPIVGCEQGGMRPVVIIQNDVGNRFSPTVIIAAITSRLDKAKLLTHIFVDSETELPKNSVVMLEQIRTIDKRRLSSKIGRLPLNIMSQVDRSLQISLGFTA